MSSCSEELLLEEREKKEEFKFSGTGGRQRILPARSGLRPWLLTHGSCKYYAAENIDRAAVFSTVNCTIFLYSLIKETFAN